MPDAISNTKAWFILGALGACIALRYARGPRSVWLALLPGTLAHELAHYALALLTRSKPRFPSLRLQREASGWVLGSVVFQPRTLTAGIVALAPLLLLPPLALLIWAHAAEGGIARALGAGYAAAMVLYGAAPSRADWSIALRYPIGPLLVVVIAAVVLGASYGPKG